MLAVVASAGIAKASDTSSIVNVSGDFSARDVATSIVVSGGFTVANGQLHVWGNDVYFGSTGYQTVDLQTNQVTTVSQPDIPVASNGFGDPFGAYDADNHVFYVGTYDGSGSGVYSYNVTTDTWTDLGIFNSLYGADISNGQVYLSGLNQIWNGSYGQDNQIALCDLSGAGSHDVLIQATGNSAHVAVDSQGNIYYANFDANPTLYRWSAAQVDSVRADLGHGSTGGDENDLYLTYADAEALATLPGGANGIAVDNGGNVFITIGSTGEVLMWNSTWGLEQIAAGVGWMGPMDTVGNFLDGGSLYVSSYGMPGLAEITTTRTIPEPASIALLVIGGLVIARRSRKTA